MIILTLALVLLIPPNDSDVQAFCAHAERPGRQLVVAVRSGRFGECVLRDKVSDVDALLEKRSGRWTVLVSGGGAISPADYLRFGVPSTNAAVLARKRALAEHYRPL